MKPRQYFTHALLEVVFYHLDCGSPEKITSELMVLAPAFRLIPSGEETILCTRCKRLLFPFKIFLTLLKLRLGNLLRRLYCVPRSPLGRTYLQN